MSIVGTRPPTLDEWNKYELHHRARLANGTYITFIDSDDYVGIHYIETLVKAIEDGKASVSICDYNNVYDDMGMEREEV